MLSSLNQKVFSLSNFFKVYLFLLLLTLAISSSLKAGSSCTEQWSEISLDRSQWKRIGDVSADTTPDSPLSFEFEQQKDSSSTDIGGAVWHSYDFSEKRGILISFKPTIKYDESYFGNVKYPQGFAIVFTSSSTENLLGVKGSGLGYEGIMNAIAFEFDFVKQTTNGDAKKPHFSVNYNINGAISASTKDRTDDAYNILLPNFYDNSLDGYAKNIIFEIEIVGKKLTVRSNLEGYKTLLSTDFPEFQQLLEQEDVHIGITASMNQNKKITIDDFKVSEVSVNEGGNLEIEGSNDIPKVKAGEEVTLLYSIESICGEKLKIYSDEYSGNALKLIINNQEVKPEAITFDEESVQLKIVISETKENIYTALVNFQGLDSIPTKFIVTTSDVNRLELCDLDEKNEYYLTPDFEQTKESFYVPLCFYDEYGNRKQATLTGMSEIKIGYPNKIIPDKIVETNIDEVNKKLIIEVPFSTFGRYEIFSEDFIQSKLRYVNLMPKFISPEKSEISILYDQNIIQSETQFVYLRIKPKDNYGRHIPSIILKDDMKCVFSATVKNEENNNFLDSEQEYKDDYVLIKVAKPQNAGKYIFEPRVQCNGLELTELKCGINFETKINNCEFFYQSDNINKNYLNIFDEYLGEYTTYKSGENNNYLYISLDERENAKLTEVVLLDENKSPYFPQASKTISAKLANEDVDVIQVGNKYAINLPKGKKRYDNYSPINSYLLVITLDNVKFNIKVKFYFLDQYMSNTQILKNEITKTTYTAFYKQNSLTIEASETLLLFDIYELAESNGKQYLGLGESLDTNKVSLYLNDVVAKSSGIVKYNNFISVTTYELSKAGKYKIELKYDGNSMITMNIEIIPKNEAYYLAYENGDIISNTENIEIGKEDHIKLIMADKYKNLIQNNEIFNAFSKIKISKFDIFDIRLDYSGKIHINNYGKTNTLQTITLTLINGKAYTIQSIYEPKFEDYDTLNSYGLYTGSAIFTKDTTVNITLYLRDKYGNIISSGEFNDNVKNAISVYIVGQNSKKIIPMTTNTISLSDKQINYKASIEKNGDYEVKIFINDFPVECKACHFRKNYESQAEVTKATIYILGNKQKIPILNSYKKDKNNIGLVDKNSGYFSFYLEERDKYDNEYKEIKSLAFSFESVDDKSLDVSSISICPYGNNEDEKNYFKLCSGVIDIWKKLPNGLYRLTALSETMIFYLYITDSFIDTTDSIPVLEYSYALLNKNEIYGKTDIPGNFILDLRNKNKKRIENVDINKIKLEVTSKSENSELKYEIAKGPEKGLLTVFLLGSHPGEYEFSIKYENDKIVENSFTYYCSCGFDKKLKLINKNEIVSNGNYVFFKVLDSNNNECNLQYNWNELSIKEYANSLFSAKDSENSYKMDTYYNHITNTFILYFDNHVPDTISLSSNLIKFEDNSNTKSITLITNILDENHFSVKHETNKLIITPLNANYKTANNFNLKNSDFDVSLIRIINDDFKILKKDFVISDDLNIVVDDTLIDAKGKYIYAVYYKGKEIFCENCIIDKDQDSVDISKTKVYHKEGDNNYIQNDPNIIMPMMKTNLPFFKINLMSSNGNLITLNSNSGININLKDENGNAIDLSTKYNSNGNIYVYISETGRDKYWALNPMTKLTLTITYSGSSYNANYYVLDYHINKPTSIENCAKGEVPQIINKKDIYIKRYNEETELEIYLSGCATEQNKVLSDLYIVNKETKAKYKANLIPTDIIGGYILFIPSNIEVSETNKYYILNKEEAKSDLFELSVIPGYDIDSVAFEKDENMDETETDKLYTYFLVKLQDANKNTITNIGRNLFINDLNILKLSKNLPYRLIYDESKKAFRCQVPITSSSNIEVEAKAARIILEINSPKFLTNSLVELKEEYSNKFSFSVKLLDEFYDEIASNIYEDKLSFKYFTINPLTEEEFITDVTHKKIVDKYEINLSESYPKYSIYGFIPYIRSLPQICPSCVKYNENPEYIYSIESGKYIPHNLSKKLFLINDKDYPIYLYLAHKQTIIETTDAEQKDIINTERTKLYLISYKGSGKIQAKINNNIFDAEFIDYFPMVENDNKKIPPYVENYGYKIYNKNNLDNIHVTFFMENRDSTGRLIITQPNLVIDNKFSGIIKRISVINTCYTGIYLIKVTFAKSANIEFYPKFNSNHVNNDNTITIQLKAISAFPTDIVLNNKEIINKNIVKYNLVTTNSFAEQTCDERLNIYMDDMYLKNFQKILVQEGDNCSLYIKFSGKAIIKSNINNFISDINNNDRTLYNINPKFSSLIIEPNVIENNEDNLSLEFIERTPAGIRYEKDEINDNKNLNIYKYISPTKIQKIKSYSGLFSSTYPFISDILNLVQGSTYVFIGDVVNNNIPPSFFHYKIKKAENEYEIKSIHANYYSEEKKSYILSNFKNSKLHGEESFEFNIPLLLKVKLLDSSGNPIEKNSEQKKELKAKLILENMDNIYVTIDLLVIQYNDDIYYIKPDISTISDLLHLPRYFTREGYYYFIQLSYDTSDFYSLLTLKKSNLQCPLINQKYSYPKTKVDLSSFTAFLHNDEEKMYIPLNAPYSHQICLQIEENGLKTIANEHLDINKLNVKIEECSDSIQYTNSYRGCFSFWTNCRSGKLNVKYNDRDSSNRIDVYSFDPNNIKMTFNKDETKNVKQPDENSVDLIFNEDDKIDSYEFFNVYINGDFLDKKYFSLNTYQNNKIKLSISQNDKINTIPKNKNIMVTFIDGGKKQKTLLNEEFILTVNQNEYVSGENYKLVIQEPFDIKVGDLIYFYILLYDANDACYYGDPDKLNQIQISLELGENTYTEHEKIQNKIEGYSQCEYIYRIEFKEISKKAGNFKINVKDQQIEGSTKLYIAPKTIDEGKSSFQGNDTFNAGQNYYLSFSGTDSEGNNINYYDLINEFDILLINISDTENPDSVVENKTEIYDYNIRVNDNNTGLNISLKIIPTYTYELRAVHNGLLMELNNNFRIKVKYGQCSMNKPDPIILPIDERNVFYIGETITVEIKCKDLLGNIVEEEGNEIFTANIKQILEDKNEIKYDYKKEFSNGRHLISFTPSQIGSYSIDINLNGKKYGNNTGVEINPINKNKYNCMDKKQVDNIIDCDDKEKKYRDFVKNILGEEFTCAESQNGYVYKCSSTEENCVSDTTTCGCSEETFTKWNGYCYSNYNNPISSVQKNKEKITCLNKIKSQDPSTEVYLCDDGTCRFNKEECTTEFQCPLGYRSCGNKCILLSEPCLIQETCTSGDVLCWDLSCAKNYDSCPTRITCPKGKVLCPDGSCLSPGHCIQPLKRTCENNQYQCPDFSCVNNKDDCKRNPVCDVGLSLCENGLCQKSCQEISEPENKFRCSNGKYVDNSKLCPSDLFVPSGYVKCPNGGIASSINDCQYVQGSVSISCPNTKPVLCPDYSCVEKSSECRLDYIPKCPPHKPYQCWNNECRKSLDQCPTPITCPSDSPVLCQNGFCAKSSDECTEKKEMSCLKYRCFDGTCVSSMELCPTHTYCGKDQIKCWNGACANDIKECRSTNLDSCPSSFPFRCPDGSCRPDYGACSSISVCPPNLPVKCFDSSCRASTDECPLYQSCGENKVSCPDGTCALSYDECNTGVTCLSGSPFLCYDNSCKVQLSDCPEPPKCGKHEVLCPNGACVSSRQNCKTFAACESIYPIKCETNTCTDDKDNCSKRKKRCPEGYVFCSNGECKTSGYLCENFECPKDKPYKCPEGICVHDEKLCDKKNGCPYNKPYKCIDGNCVEDSKLCPTSYECKDPDTRLCPDGSCLKESEECPLENGCYKDRPFKCADGSCVNPLTTSCYPVLCPFSKPYKCPNGNCVENSADCSNDLFENELTECGNGLILCADGRCVESSDYCRPLFECDNSYKKCLDGTCRVSLDLCPENVKCPESRPYPCNENSYCAKNSEECNAGLICPNKYVKCYNDGLCKANLEQCKHEPNTDNICAFVNKQMCKNGRCLDSKYDCSLVSDACPDDDKPYLCPNGECVNNLLECSITDNNNICEEGKVMCPSGRCVENKKEILRASCTNNIGCPLDKPYRCSNGECVQSERKCDVTSLFDDNKLRSNIICDVSKPYLCHDKTCVSDTRFCKVSVDCPTNMTKCDNGYCINEGETCSKYSGYCPPANPIHCPSGTCVDDIVKCTSSFNIPTCVDGEFYCARMNKCMKNKLDCLLYLENILEKNDTVYNSLRSLNEDMENIVNPLNDEEFIKMHKNKNKIISLKEEEDESDKEIDKIEGTICYDGTIASDSEKCPIVPACKIGQYRCDNGACANDLSLCPVDDKYICLPGQKKCPDGLCHKDCSEVAFHGCEVGKYQCSNGQCLDDKYDCIGHSMCPDPAYPFRCMTGECKSEPGECELIERLGNVKNLTYSFNKLNKINFNFAFNVYGHSVGRIELPANSLKLNNDFSKLYLEEVSSSLLTDSSLYNNSAEFLFNVSNSISGSEGVLNFENSVMSPVFKFYSKNNDINFKFPGKIDIAHNEYISSSFYPYDYCLAKLNGYDLINDKINPNSENKGWECIERQTKEGQTEFQIKEFGVYAVILSPLRNKVNYFGDSAAKNFFLENVKIILIVLAIIIVVIALVFYIFSRVTRYRKKYHENREKILLMKQQREEYENMTTDIFGQTLGDNINGIVYKSNPAYTVTDEIKKQGGSLEDEIEKLQIECKNVTEQNERLQKEIEEVTKKYEKLSESIENMNK